MIRLVLIVAASFARSSWIQAPEPIVLMEVAWDDPETRLFSECLVHRETSIARTNTRRC